MELRAWDWEGSSAGAEASPKKLLRRGSKLDTAPLERAKLQGPDSQAAHAMIPASASRALGCPEPVVFHIANRLLIDTAVTCRHYPGPWPAPQDP